jgi:uncharacterized protein YkwD
VRWRTECCLLLATLLFMAIPACQAVENTDTPAPPTATPTYSLSPTSLPTSTRTLISSPSPVPPTVEPTPVIHTVQLGDTLLGLAMQYGVPMAAIQLQNGMGESIVLYAGQALAIPSPSGWEGASPFWVVYEVKKGETYGLEEEVLVDVNRLTGAAELQPGDQLVLPLEKPAAAYLPTVVPTSTLTPVPTDAPAPVPTLILATAPSDMAGWPRETVAVINQVRAAHGRSPFAYSDTLAQAAQAHADDCADRGWCSHTGSDGSDVKTRIVRAGYAPAGWAECWAQSRDPQHAVDMWMDEVPPDDAHRRTLLSTYVTEIGVGVARTTWGYYFVADFGRP